jgi:hypothetical protein
MSVSGIPLSSAGQRDVFVARYNSTGAINWASGGGGVEDDRGLAAATSGSAVTARGLFKGTGILAGRVLTSSGTIDGFAFQVLP